MGTDRARLEQLRVSKPKLWQQQDGTYYCDDELSMLHARIIRHLAATGEKNRIGFVLFAQTVLFMHFSHRQQAPGFWGVASSKGLR